MPSGNNATRSGCFVILFLVGVILIVELIVVGPAGFANKFTAWKASAYGSDWYIIHYLPDGSFNEFHLKNAAVHNESQSDGIYFQWEGSTVHLSTYYEYVQNPTPQVVEKLTKGHSGS